MNPEEDSESKMEEIIYQCRHTGPEYEEDNRRFFAFIEESCVGTLAEDIIKGFVTNRDGQAALEAIREAFEKGERREERIRTATENIGHGEVGLTFRQHGTMPFTKYSSHLRESYEVLSHKDAVYEDCDKVKRLLEGMKGESCGS